MLGRQNTTRVRNLFETKLNEQDAVKTYRNTVYFSEALTCPRSLIQPQLSNVRGF